MRNDEFERFINSISNKNNNKLNYSKLKKWLIVNFIKGSGKWGQKRNKTSSTVQIIDNFDYSPFIPEQNKQFYKWTIVLTSDVWRNRKYNLKKWLENWKNKLLKLFTIQKERSIDEKREKERKKKIKDKQIESKWKIKYKNRKEWFDSTLYFLTYPSNSFFIYFHYIIFVGNIIFSFKYTFR